MFKASEGLYKKYVETKYGIRVCSGKLELTEVEELLDNLALLDYFKYNTCDCDKDKLIENLT